ncbi:hypothetical protein EHQ16_05250 [Leptospira kanakyensis]|uniref:Uncharacterized protein n=1 Tax=Leptospira kanakyensis TaxID=2484968 RepID=A0A6N4PY32_9LEPT|nr:hypothetical protein [Leptospira kanakyensis]TGK50547.1 hypothetical protein EHQ11_12770 [Leptospira kanakyensis]TGK63852.1 hypothetical protein EHQ16_05250 [Leptospira kanakyensis]TGK69685.1 hypothetical protein EHQ18_12930 [Leptospira kanakyensis]
MKIKEKLGLILNSIIQLIFIRLSLLVILTLIVFILFYFLALGIVHISAIPIRLIILPIILGCSFFSFSKIPKLLKRNYSLNWWHYPLILFSVFLLALILSFVSGFIFLGESNSSDPSTLIYLFSGFAIGIFLGSTFTLIGYDYLMNKEIDIKELYNYSLSLILLIISIITLFGLLVLMKV